MVQPCFLTKPDSGSTDHCIATARSWYNAEGDIRDYLAQYSNHGAALNVVMGPSGAKVVVNADAGIQK